MADDKKGLIDVDSIPVVELNVEEINSRMHTHLLVYLQMLTKMRIGASSLKKTKKTKRSKRPKSPPKLPVYAEEEMPEDAAVSEDEKEDNSNRKNKTKATLYTKKSTRDIFDNAEEAGLNNVDLSTPLGEDEKFQQVKAYLSPEELRLQEEAKYRSERRQLRALQVILDIYTLSDVANHHQ